MQNGVPVSTVKQPKQPSGSTNDTELVLSIVRNGARHASRDRRASGLRPELQRRPGGQIALPAATSSLVMPVAAPTLHACSCWSGGDGGSPPRAALPPAARPHHGGSNR